MLDLLKLLLARGAPLHGETTYHETALGHLVRYARFDAVQLLLDAGCDVGKVNLTPLSRMVALGTLGDVERGLATGPSLDDCDQRGRTPFIIAVHAGDLDKAECLRRHGADIHARDCNGQSAIFYAIGSHHPSLLTWLLNLGFDPEETSTNECTPLRHAVEWDDAECVAILLARRVQVDSRWNDTTPLYNARSRVIVLSLLEGGADPAQLSLSSSQVLHRFKQGQCGAPSVSGSPSLC